MTGFPKTYDSDAYVIFGTAYTSLTYRGRYLVRSLESAARRTSASFLLPTQRDNQRIQNEEVRVA